MRVIDLLTDLRERKAIPCSTEGRKTGEPSTAELRRWCAKGSVWINGNQAKAGDTVEFPLESLIFFKGSRRHTTVWLTEKAWRRGDNDV